jgi:hypothetical protein
MYSKAVLENTQQIGTILQYLTVHYSTPVDPVQSITSHSTSLPFILILSLHLRLSLPSCLFISKFRTKLLDLFLISPIRAACLNSVTLTVLSEDWQLIIYSLRNSLSSIQKLPRSQIKISPSTPCSQMSPNHSLPVHFEVCLFPSCDVSQQAIYSMERRLAFRTTPVPATSEFIL